MYQSKPLVNLGWALVDPGYFEGQITPIDQPLTSNVPLVVGKVTLEWGKQNLHNLQQEEKFLGRGGGINNVIYRMNTNRTVLSAVRVELYRSAGVGVGNEAYV